MTHLDVVVPLAPGFEETEAVAVIDVLRRAGLRTTIAGLQDGPIEGAHGIRVTPDATLKALDTTGATAVVLPGGMPGATNLRDDPLVRKLLIDVYGRGGVVAAVCAAPIALAAAVLLKGKRATCYPGFEDQLGDARRETDRVVVDGRVVTSRGPGTALEFALAVVRLLKSADVATTLGKQMLVAGAG
jgi:protein deglycase